MQELFANQNPLAPVELLCIFIQQSIQSRINQTDGEPITHFATYYLLSGGTTNMTLLILSKQHQLQGLEPFIFSLHHKPHLALHRIRHSPYRVCLCEVQQLPLQPILPGRHDQVGYNRTQKCSPQTGSTGVYVSSLIRYWYEKELVIYLISYV